MKVVAQYKGHMFDDKHHKELRLLVSNYQHMKYLDDLELDKQYSIEIKEIKSKRSINQNSLLWELLHKLEQHTHEPAIDWYVKSLIDTGAIAEYVWAMEKTEDSLRKQFRAVIRVKPHKIGDSDGWLYRVIVGSSKFNVEEMNRLIDTVLRYCNEHNIDTEVLG
jgi:hypothetical protein